MPAGRVRSMTPDGFLMSRSVHSAEEANAAAAGADYLVAGTVFRTASKPGQTVWLGLPGLAAVVRAVSRARAGDGRHVRGAWAPEVAGTGARGVSAIGLFAEIRIGR